jgi:hypothetical protein
MELKLLLTEDAMTRLLNKKTMLSSDSEEKKAFF